MEFPEGFDDDAKALVELVLVSFSIASWGSCWHDLIHLLRILIRLSDLHQARSNRIPSSELLTLAISGPKLPLRFELVFLNLHLLLLLQNQARTFGLYSTMKCRTAGSSMMMALIRLGIAISLQLMTNARGILCTTDRLQLKQSDLSTEEMVTVIVVVGGTQMLALDHLDFPDEDG